MCSWFIPFFTITFIEGLIDPRFIEGDTIHTIIPSASQVTAQATAQVTAQATEQATAQADKEIEKLLECCTTPGLGVKCRNF